MSQAGGPSSLVATEVRIPFVPDLRAIEDGTAERKVSEFLDRVVLMAREKFTPVFDDLERRFAALQPATGPSPQTQTAPAPLVRPQEDLMLSKATEIVSLLNSIDSHVDAIEQNTANPENP